jgi:hypothetical protein
MIRFRNICFGPSTRARKCGSSLHTKQCVCLRSEHIFGSPVSWARRLGVNPHCEAFTPALWPQSAFKIRSGGPTRKPRHIAGELVEGRGFQFFQIALAGGSQRKNVFGNLECRSRLVTRKSAVANHLVQGAAQGGDRCGFIAHGGAIASALDSHMTAGKYARREPATRSNVIGKRWRDGGAGEGCRAVRTARAIPAIRRGCRLSAASSRSRCAGSDRWRDAATSAPSAAASAPD